MSIEITREELIEIKIALSRAGDYMQRHDLVLSQLANKLEICQNQANMNTDRLDQEIRARSKSDLRLESLPQQLSKAQTDIAVLQENEERANSRFNMIAASFWAAIAVAVIAMFQTANTKAKADLPDHRADRPVSQTLPSPNNR